MNREEREAQVRRFWFDEGNVEDAVRRLVDVWEHDVADKRYEQTALMITGKWRAENPNARVFIWRLTLMCGHLRLWGPFTQGTHQKYVGDQVACNICPLVKHETGRIAQQHTIVNVEEVDERDCSPAWIETGLL